MDLCKRIIEAVQAGGAARQAARRFAISPSSASGGNVLAALASCVLLLSGLGMAAAEDELLDDVRHRAEQGDAFYQTGLGIMYLEGDGVPKNDAEAVKWFRMAAEQGDAGSRFGVVTAQFYLGIMYVNGWGVPQDFPEAVKWYRMAAEQGHALSQYALGILYRAGAFGVVPQDLVQAYAWFNIAATQGNEDAARERKGLGETITNEQRARARELSREYWEAYVLPFRN
jgi:TPR repeat protein